MGHVFIATLTFIQTIDEYDYILKGGGGGKAKHLGGGGYFFYDILKRVSTERLFFYNNLKIK